VGEGDSQAAADLSTAAAVSDAAVSDAAVSDAAFHAAAVASTGTNRLDVASADSISISINEDGTAARISEVARADSGEKHPHSIALEFTSFGVTTTNGALEIYRIAAAAIFS
jgi:hypothetical protein